MLSLALELRTAETVKLHMIQMPSGPYSFSPSVNDVDGSVFGLILLDDLGFLHDWDHVAGRESHLVGPHHQLERILVHPHGRLVLLHHDYAVLGVEVWREKLGGNLNGGKVILQQSVAQTHNLVYFTFKVFFLDRTVLRTQSCCCCCCLLSASLSSSMFVLSLSFAISLQTAWRCSG